MYDAVIIGSGFGGAVVACRLSEAGMRVCLLERGRRWGRSDFPRPGTGNWRWDPPRETGIFELRRLGRLEALVASGLGGGSLVYTNVQMRAPEEALEGWPAELRRAALEPYYRRVEEMLEPAPPPRTLPKMRALEQAARRLGRPDRYEPARLAIRWGEEGIEEINKHGAAQTGCIYCGMCVLGCHVHAKNTLDLNYLKRAENCGAHIIALAQAVAIEPLGSGYAVHYRDLSAGIERSVSGAIVVVSAGTLGSAELLLRCKYLYKTLPALSPRLGYNFSGNGDFFGAVIQSLDRLEPYYGPTVTAMLDYWDDARFFLLEGGLPEAFAERWRAPLLRLAWLWNFKLKLSNILARLGLAEERPAPPLPGRSAREAAARLMPLFLMGLDASDGRLYLDKKGRLALDWRHGKSLDLFREMKRRMRELGRAAGGLTLISPQWTFRRRLTTVHPLGGCSIGRSLQDGVVDDCGRAFGYRGLYIADGSILRGAIGVPPSMTIAALAERVAEGITADAGERSREPEVGR